MANKRAATHLSGQVHTSGSADGVETPATETGKKARGGKEAATFVYEARFMRELFAWVSAFRDQVNLEVRREGISLKTLDRAQIAFIAMTLVRSGAVHYSFTLRDPSETLVVGLPVKSWLATLKGVAKHSPHVRIQVEKGADDTVIQFGVHKSQSEFAVRHAFKISNIAMETPALEVPTFKSWISLSCDSRLLHREVATRIKFKPDSIAFVIHGYVQEDRGGGGGGVGRNLEDELAAELAGQPVRSEPLFVPDRLVLESCDKSVSFLTPFDIVQRRSDDIAQNNERPAWGRGAELRVVDEEPIDNADDDDDDNNHPLPRARRLAELEDPEADAAIASGTDVYSVSLRSFDDHSRPEKSDEGPAGPVRFEFSPGCLNNITAGASFANRAVVDILAQGILRIDYDMNKIGNLQCFLGAKIAG